MIFKALFVAIATDSSSALDILRILAAPADALANAGLATIASSLIDYSKQIVFNPSAFSITLLTAVVYYLAGRRLLAPLRNLSGALQEALREIPVAGDTESAPKAPRSWILELADRISAVENKSSEDRRTRVAWQLRRFEKAWRENVLEDVGDTYVSTACPADYLTIDRLLPAAYGFAALRAIPGVMTSLGILGTFVGLSIGVAGIQHDLGSPTPHTPASLSIPSNGQVSAVPTTNPAAPVPPSLETVPNSTKDDDLQKVIAPVLRLLNGMTTAFSTSLLGIVLALSWMLRERTSLKRAELQCEALIERIENKFPSIGPNEAWFYALRIATEQKNTIKSLGTDIATKVIEGMDISIQTHLVPQVAQMGEVVDRVANLSGATQIEGMEKMVQRFGDLLGDRLRTQFDNLASTIENLCAWQQETKQSLNQILIGLRDTTEVQDRMMRTSSQAAELFQASLGDLGEMHQRLSAATDSFRSLGDQMQELNAEARSSHAALFERMLGLQTALQEAMNGLSRLTSTHQSAVDTQLERVNALLEASGRQATTLDDRLSTSMAKFVEDCRQGVELTFGQFDEQLGKLAATLSGTVHETDETIRELSAKLHAINDTVDHFDGTLTALETNTRRFVVAIDRLSSVSGNGQPAAESS